MSMILAAALAATAAKPQTVDRGVPIPKSFAPDAENRREIETLLASYTRAVSTKNRALFLTLLQNPDIPFAGIWGERLKPDVDLRQFSSFDKGVFGGSPFTQRFQDVRIEQDGDLANVSLVFVNTRPDGSESWGLKTLQLVKIAGQWKIVSEFYTGHPLEKQSH